MFAFVSVLLISFYEAVGILTPTDACQDLPPAEITGVSGGLAGASLCFALGVIGFGRWRDKKHPDSDASSLSTEPPTSTESSASSSPAVAAQIGNSSPNEDILLNNTLE